MALNHFPRLQVNDSAHMVLPDAKQRRNFRLSEPGATKRANGGNIFTGQFVLSSKFLFQVAHVVLMRPFKQVVWVAANWVIAMVANIKICLPAICKLPRNSVRISSHAINSNATITLGGKPGPRPAHILFRSLHPAPEPLRESFPAVHRSVSVALEVVRLFSSNLPLPAVGTNIRFRGQSAAACTQFLHG